MDHVGALAAGDGNKGRKEFGGSSSPSSPIPLSTNSERQSIDSTTTKGPPYSTIQDNLAALALDPDSDIDLPDPPPQKMRINNTDVYKLHTLNCLITQIGAAPCRVLIEARLSILDQTNEGARYLMRDGCAYAQLLNVPLSVSSKIKKGKWYEVVGEAAGIGAGDCGAVHYLGLRKPQHDVRPPPPQPLVKAEWLDDPKTCPNCGKPLADSDHRDLEPYDDCPHPTHPRTMKCSDCGEWGHLWICCPYMVSPSGVLPRVRSPELTLEEWKEFCSFDMREFGNGDPDWWAESGAPNGGMEV